MKKYLIIFLSLIFSLQAKAEVIYSDYSDYTSFQEEEVVETDIISVDTKNKYKIYKLETEGEYFLENQNPIEYPNIDENNYIYMNFDLWTINKPDDIKNRIVEEKMGIAGPIVRYIYLYNPKGVDNHFNIREIEIYDNYYNKINYAYACYNCNSDFAPYINNGNIDENNAYLLNDIGLLEIDLGAYYNIENIMFSMYEYAESNEERSIDIKFTNEHDFNSEHYVSTHITNNNYYYSTSQYGNPIFININNDDLNLEYHFDESFAKLYRFQDKYFYYYGLEKRIYADDYYEQVNEEYPYMNEENYKTYYRYKKRDKVIIEDNLVINNKDFNLNNFILESTINDIKIDNNINYNANGIYDISFILPFTKIDKKVEVNLIENDLKILESENKKLQKENDKLVKNNEKLTNNNSELKVQNKELEKVNKSLTKENDKLVKNNEKLTNNNNELKTKNEELKLQIDNLEREKNNIENLVIEYDQKIKIDDENINKLMSINDELNNKIVKQWENINLLTNINNDNTQKYNNDILLLNEKLESITTDKQQLEDDYGICLDEQMIEEENNQKINKRKNNTIYLIVILTILMNIGIIREIYKKKVELK